MYKFLVSFFLVIAISSSIKAQSVTGILQDASEKTAISNATIRLSPADSSAPGFTSVSDSKGVFYFNQIPAGNYTLTVSSIGYNTYTKSVTINSSASNNIGIIAISKGAKTLTTVVISGAPPAVKQNNDTMEFGASQYKVNPDATSEDLIKKMPGITVDKKTGAVTAMGETVKKVTVDGRDFFGDDATATLRNLPADV
ncbi:MAG: carboxypeptidase-like regulatory domain-containing protein, partial [Bacteroidota bacterium]|nr:carboxypeptidase-like regulatory domain-containing protein [Bacteroidota bacterium]